MDKKQIRMFSLILAGLFFSLSFLGGCVGKDTADPTTVSMEQEETAPAYEQFTENQADAQQLFRELEHSLFQEEVSISQLDLHYLLKNPSLWGISSAQYLYTPITKEFMEQSKANRQELKETLAGFDSGSLSEDQKMTCLVLESLLATEERCEGLELYYQPLASTIGIQAQLPILLAEYRFDSRQDVEDYLVLLDGVDDYFTEILAFEQEKAGAGLMMSDTSIDHVIESCESYLLVRGDNFMIDTFRERLDGVPGLKEEEKDAYLAKHESLLETAFLPAYESLIEGMAALKGTGTNDGGQCGYPRGKEYYEYLAFANTGTSCQSVEEMIAMVERTVQDAVEEIAVVLSEHPELAEQAGKAVYRQTDPSAIMEELKALTGAEFPELPACNYVLKDVPEALELSLSPAFYLTSPLDDSLNQIIYINRNERYASQPLYHTLAHEGYPGHLYQTVYFHSNENSDLRKVLSFPGYTEGWATYVEQLSYRLDNGLEPELARLLAANALASLGIHAFLDLSINYLGWDKEDVAEYLSDYYADPGSVTNAIFEVMVENPANYLSYFIGCVEIMEMRSEAETQLGERFSALEFHRFILDMGNAPFDVIRLYFSDWLAGQGV